MSDQIEKQNELIISLLGKLVYKNNELKELVMKGSKKPNEMVSAYNLCDGKTTITEISKKSHVTIAALSFAVDRWEELGIIYKKMGKGNQVWPLRLFKIDEVI